MEDPWGSPWTVADAASPPKIDLPAAPPSVHFPLENNNTTTSVAAAAGSNANSPRKGAQSPWGDEFEDDNVWGGWNDGAAGAAGANSPGWGRSPGLKHVAPSVSSRGASPDPWRLSSDDRRRSSSVNKRSALGEGDRIGDSGISLGPNQSTSRLERKPSTESGFGAQDAWTSPGQPPALEVIKPLPLVIRTSADEPASIDVTPQVETKREDASPKTASPTQPPSKVQGLVDHYDEIARRSVSPASPATTEPPPLRKVSQKLEPNGNISPTADHEDTSEAQDDLAPHAEVDIASSEEEVAEDDEPRTVETAQTVQPEVLPDTHIAQTPTEEKPKPASVNVTIDLSKLDDLFPSTPEITTEPELVPDVIIDDSFTSITERKAWYRLSRQGSKLMHSGDLETYVRMDWARSTVRQDTLKIVRRWMEEDSMTGRPALGRKNGVIGANVFNWNSSAPAVEIGELLGKKKGHTRQASSSSKASMSSPRVASFEWASPPTSPATAGPPPSLAGRFKSSVSRPNRPQSLVAPSTSLARDEPESPYAETNRVPRPTSLIAPPPELIVQPTISETLSQPQRLNGIGNDGFEDGDGDDDDDWGEMVTSPIPDAAHSKPAPLSNGYERRASAKTISPIEKSSGFEIQDLHGGSDVSSSPAHKKGAPIRQQSTDTWNLNGVETLTHDHEESRGSVAPSHAAELVGIDTEPTSAPPLTLKTDHHEPAETTAQPHPFAWFDEPPPSAPIIEAKSTPSAGRFNFNEPSPISPKPPLQSAPAVEDVDEEVVANILRGIPDLSYMLR